MKVILKKKADNTIYDYECVQEKNEDKIEPYVNSLVIKGGIVEVIDVDITPFIQHLIDKENEVARYNYDAIKDIKDKLYDIMDDINDLQTVEEEE